jgi:hypothetical protein
VICPATWQRITTTIYTVCPSGNESHVRRYVFFIALLNPRDSAHEQAVLLSHATPGRFLTTQWVLTEVADAFADVLDRH